MTETLSKWLEDNKMVVSESQLDGSDIITIEEVGTFLYLQPFDGKIIDEDFAFILSDEEFDILDEKKVNYILFEFGSKFYYAEYNDQEQIADLERKEYTGIQVM